MSPLFKQVFPSIKAVKIFRAALWILGEYCESQDLIQSVMHQVCCPFTRAVVMVVRSNVVKVQIEIYILMI